MSSAETDNCIRGAYRKITIAFSPIAEVMRKITIPNFRRCSDDIRYSVLKISDNATEQDFRRETINALQMNV